MGVGQRYLVKDEGKQLNPRMILAALESSKGLTKNQVPMQDFRLSRWITDGEERSTQ